MKKPRVRFVVALLVAIALHDGYMLATRPRRPRGVVVEVAPISGPAVTITSPHRDVTYIRQIPPTTCWYEGRPFPPRSDGMCYAGDASGSSATVPSWDARSQP